MWPPQGSLRCLQSTGKERQKSKWILYKTYWNLCYKEIQAKSSGNSRQAPVCTGLYTDSLSSQKHYSRKKKISATYLQILFFKISLGLQVKKKKHTISPPGYEAPMCCLESIRQSSCLSSGEEELWRFFWDSAFRRWGGVYKSKSYFIRLLYVLNEKYL